MPGPEPVPRRAAARTPRSSALPGLGAPFPASTKGPAGGRVRGGGGAGGASRRRTKFWSRLSSEEGSGRPQRPAGFLPPRGEEEPPAPEADWGISGSGAPHPPPPSFGVISADGKLSSVWQTWCLCARSRFALGLFCFWRNYGAGRLHKLGAFTIECQKEKFFFLSDLV